VIAGSLSPPFWGAQTLSEISLDLLWPLLDRKALFRGGWGAGGLTGPAWEEIEAEFAARLRVMQVEAGAYLQPQAVYGYFPAHSDGEALVIYDPAAPSARQEVARFPFPRQPGGQRLCLADYFAPVGGPLDVAIFQVVTVGPGATARYAALEAEGAYSEAYFVHGLASHITEALAAWVHQRVRDDLGLAEKQGRRYSWGYPACPDVSQHREVFRLLPAEAALGMALTAAGQLVPEHSTAALIVTHPAARYFVVRSR